MKERLGKRLRKLRDQRRMSQHDVAKDLNLSQQTIAAYENGVIDIPISKLQLLADYYAVSMTWLLSPDEAEEPVRA